MTISAGWRRVSSVAVAGGMWSGATRRMGAPNAAAAGPPARASGKLKPVVTTTVGAPRGWRSWEMAAAVAKRSAPHSRRTHGSARRNTSGTLFPSAATRFDANESKATERPSPFIAGRSLTPSAWPPSDATLTRRVSPVSVSCTNTSGVLLVSPGTRLAANDWKATLAPWPLIAGW